MDYQAQGLSDATDFDIVNDIQLMINAESMLRAMRYNAITVETMLRDGHSKFTYRGTSETILQEYTARPHGTLNRRPHSGYDPGQHSPGPSRWRGDNRALSFHRLRSDFPQHPRQELP